MSEPIGGNGPRSMSLSQQYVLRTALWNAAAELAEEGNGAAENAFLMLGYIVSDLQSGELADCSTGWNELSHEIMCAAAYLNGGELAGRKSSDSHRS